MAPSFATPPNGRKDIAHLQLPREEAKGRLAPFGQLAKKTFAFSSLRPSLLPSPHGTCSPRAFQAAEVRSGNWLGTGSKLEKVSP